MTVRALPAPHTIANVAALTLIVLFCAWLGPHILGVATATDAESYWRARLGPSMYDLRPGEVAYLYSPVIAQLYAPLTALPFLAFYWLLMAANVAALVWMLGPVLALIALAFPPIPLELGVGNIHLLLGAAIVAGVRRREWWAVLPLTKVTPSVIVAVDLFRGQWHDALRPLLLAGAMAAVSVIVAPDLWLAWVRLLASNDRSLVPAGFEVITLALPLRLLLSIGLVGLAARLQRPALLPVAALLALPFIWTNSLALLVACWPLRSGWTHPRRLPT